LLDSLVDLAAGMFDVPIAAASLVDRERQWFKASCGLAASETPRDESFCAHVVANPVVTMVPDTLHDERFADHPAVTGLPGVRFYAGHPIILADGHCIGTLCIADVRPRHLDGNALGRLGKLAELVLSTIRPNKEDFA
jgi:GAF domain-containing protein